VAERPLAGLRESLALPVTRGCDRLGQLTELVIGEAR
jgi:hypothetical protein